jgi:ATP-binding cassette subfamily F protein 3
VTFQVKKHDRLFITGENGCGKSTLIKILAGRLGADSGSVLLGSNVKIGYYDQENQDLHPSSTVLDELWNTYPTMTETLLRNTLALFLFKGDDVYKRVSLLSGGEKARLTLAKLMLSKMNLLILDEPTNHLDIVSRERLEKAIAEFEGTVIAVSHDRYFVNKLATRIADFGTFENGGVYVYEGNYQSFLDYKRSVQTSDGKSAKVEVMTASKEQYLNAKRDQADKRKQERKIIKAKEDIERLEKRIEELNVEMSGDVAFDYVKLTALSEEYDECEARLMELYELLDELSEL